MIDFRAPSRLTLAAGLGSLLATDAGPVLAARRPATAASAQAGRRPAQGARGREDVAGAIRQGRAGHRRARQRRAGHRLRDPAARQVPCPQHQHRRAGQGELQAPGGGGEHQRPAALHPRGHDQEEPGQDARADRRHLRGAQEAVRPLAAEAGNRRRAFRPHPALQEGGPGGADRGAPEAAGGQADRRRDRATTRSTAS